MTVESSWLRQSVGRPSLPLFECLNFDTSRVPVFEEKTRDRLERAHRRRETRRVSACHTLPS